MKTGGPPKNLYDSGRRQWYAKYRVECDFCHAIAIDRWQGHNVCRYHLNPPMQRARLRDGTCAIEAVDRLTVSPRSSAAMWSETSACIDLRSC